MYYPKFTVSNQKEESIGIQRVKHKQLANYNVFLFCRLLITYPNSWDPDQVRQNVGPDLDGNRLTL